jgi:chlorophyllide a hydrolase
VDVQFEQTRSASHATPVRVHYSIRPILSYWGVSLLAGVVFLFHDLRTWAIPQTLARSSLMIYLIVSFVLSQILYVIVARHDDRPLLWGPTWLFAIGNGICETFAFALSYRFGEVLGFGVFQLFAPQAADLAGFIAGVITFSIYGGLIHGLFWLKILPPHLNDDPTSRVIRRFRPLAEVGLVLGWSLCFWLTRDIWTVVFFHILVDFCLMWRVRPSLFTASAGAH